MPRPKESRYTREANAYAKAVLSGKIAACWQVKAACQRHLDDFSRDDLEYRDDLAEHVCRFAENMPHVTGPLAGELIELQPWQMLLLISPFAWIVKATGLRRYREMFVLLPRGSAKSTIGAVIGNYMTFMLGQGGAQGLTGATSMKQALEVFDSARRMVLMSPALQEAAGIEVAARSIYQPSTGSSFQPVIAKTKDGGAPWICIADELHQALDDTQLNAFRTGMGKRRGSDPLLLIISTAGTNVAGVCRQEQLYFEDVLKGTIADDSKFALIYTIDHDDDWRNFGNWKKANPNYGVSVDENHLRGEYAKALQSPSYQAICLTKYLNVWANTASGWLNSIDWANAAKPDLRISTSALCWIGVDLSTKTDITAVTLVARLEDGTFALQPYLFLPEGALLKSKNTKAYQQWIASGALIKTPGNASDHAAVEELLIDLCKTYNVQQVLFDSWQSHGMMQRLQAEGLSCVSFGQTAKNFTAPMVDFEADLMNGNIVHPDNPCLNWMAGNISVKTHGILMSPQKPTGQDHLKIDGMITSLMAYAQATAEEVKEEPPAFFFV